MKAVQLGLGGPPVSRIQIVEATVGSRICNVFYAAPPSYPQGVSDGRPLWVASD